MFHFFLPPEGEGWKVRRGGSSFKFLSFDEFREGEGRNLGSLSSVMEGREGEEEGKYREGGREEGSGGGRKRGGWKEEGKEGQSG